MSRDELLPLRMSLQVALAEQQYQLEAALRKALRPWLAAARRAVGGDEEVILLAAGPPDPAAVAGTTAIWMDGVDRNVQPAVGAIFESTVEVAVQAGFDLSFVPVQAMRDQYWREVRSRIGWLPNEVYRQMVAVMAQAMAAQASISKMTIALEKVLSQAGMDVEMTTMARTEATAAWNAGTWNAWLYADDLLGEQHEKVWIATHDLRTRPTHRAADTQRVPLAQPFLVGGFPLMFPGSPAGPVGETINCRCAMILLAPDEPFPDVPRQPWQQTAAGMVDIGRSGEAAGLPSITGTVIDLGRSNEAVGPKPIIEAFHLPGKHDQRTHGRRRIAIALGQPPPPRGELADRIAQWHSDIDDMSTLMSDVLSGVKRAGSLSYGNGGGSRIDLVQFGNGHEGVVSTYLGEAGTHAEYTPQRQADSDQLSSTLARALGVPAPRVMRTDEDRTVSDLIEGPTWAEIEGIMRGDVRGYELEGETPDQKRFHEDFQGPRAKKAQERDIADARYDVMTSTGAARLGVLDLLTGTDARDPGSIVIDRDGNPATVQMSHAWDQRMGPEVVSSEVAPVDYKAGQPKRKGVKKKATETVIPGGGRVPPQPIMADVPEGGLIMWDAYALHGAWVDNPLTQADVAWLRERLDDLRTDFEALDQGDWWHFASDRLDAIAAHATGTTNLFAPGSTAAGIAVVTAQPGTTDHPDRTANEAQGGVGGIQLDGHAEPEEPGLFHLPGRHDQKTHGARGAGRPLSALWTDTEQTVRAIWEGPRGGLLSEVDTWQQEGGPPPKPGWVDVTGYVNDPDGKRVGLWGRRVVFGDGPTYVEHSTLDLMPEAQKKGFATEFNEQAYASYREMGVDHVRVWATKKGRVAWALAGFDWRSEAEGRRQIEDFLAHATAMASTRADDSTLAGELAELRRRLEEGQFGVAGSDGWPTPYDLAMVGRRPGDSEWVGQETMLALMPWGGRLWMRDFDG